MQNHDKSQSAPSTATLSSASPSKKNAVLFDLGGVILGSPLHAIRDDEAELADLVDMTLDQLA